MNKPLIGISTNLLNGVAAFGVTVGSIVPYVVYTPYDYTLAIIKGGGIPIHLPLVEDEELMRAMVEKVDGIVLTGGDDLDPSIWGEDLHPKLGPFECKRDNFDMTLAKLTMEMDKPLLGICRGSQVINVSQGGTMYQDITSQFEGAIRHTLIGISPKDHYSHEVKLEKGCKLEKIYGADTLKTNSFHHQAIKDLGANLKVVGKTKDGSIESIEGVNNSWVVGVQWHPEMMLSGKPEVLPIFKAFVDAATK